MWTTTLFRHLALYSNVLVAALIGCPGQSPQVLAQTPEKFSVPADSPRWELQEQAKVTEYQGRKCLLLDGGAAILKDFEMRDGVVDMDVASSGSRGFVGIQFRLDKDGRLLPKETEQQ